MQQRYANWPNLTQPGNRQTAAQRSPNLDTDIQFEDQSLESALSPRLPVHAKLGIALASEQPLSDQIWTDSRHDRSPPGVTDHIRSLSTPYSESRPLFRPLSGSQPEVLSSNRFANTTAAMLTPLSSNSNAGHSTISQASNTRNSANDRHQPHKRGNSQLDRHHEVASKHRRAHAGLYDFPQSASPKSTRKHSNVKLRNHVDDDRSEASDSDSTRPRGQRHYSHCHSCGAPSPPDDLRSSHSSTKNAIPTSPRTSARPNTSDNSIGLSDCSMALENLAGKSDLAKKREFCRPSGGSRNNFGEHLADGDLDLNNIINPSSSYQHGVERVVIVYRYGNG